MKYVFNANGQLISKEDRNGNSIRLTYDEEGRLINAENNSQATFIFSYDEDGKLKQVADNAGRTVNLEYEQDTLICVTDEEKGQYQFGYDHTNRLIKIINPLGVDIINNEYDEKRRMKRQVFPDGGVISYEYDDEENRLVLTEQNGNEIIHVHDEKFRSVETIYTDGAEKHAYNEQNLRTLHVDKNGNETKYSYDNRGNLVKVVNPLNETMHTDYNHLNKPVRIKLCGEVKLQTKYDAHGNATEVKDALERTSKIEYNETGRSVKIIQPDSSVISIVYDERGNILTVNEPGSSTEYEYDELNRVIATIDGNGNRTSYEYNAKDDITKVINALGFERSYTYNAAGKVIKIVDFDGGIIAREYNYLGKPSRLIDQAGNETKLEYDIMWNVTGVTDQNRNKTVFEYNKLNRLVKVINATGAQVKYEYDPNGNRTAISDPKGRQTLLSYDALNRVIEVIEPDGTKTNLVYNSMGQITGVIDALGNESKITYDKAGQKISETDPAGRKLQYSYNQLGQVTRVIDSAGRITGYEYLPGGLLEKVIYPDGRSMKYTYDANKNIISQTSQDGFTFNYEYDCLNQVTSIWSNQGQKKKYAYDAVGNVTAVTDANGNTTSYVHSPIGNLISEIDPLGNRTEYDYDKMGNLIEVRQLAELNEAKRINEQNGKLRATRYERNELGQVERIIDALGNMETYTYDEAGNVVVKQDKDGYYTKFVYGVTNLLEEVSYADGKSVKFSYNPLKQLTEIKDWLGVTAIEVDEIGQANKVTDFKGREVEYTFGSEGERTGIKYPDGKVVEYKYDDALRLKTLVDGERRIDYVYDENSRLSSKLFPNGVSTKYSYNDMGLLAEFSQSDKDGILDKYTYTYDNMINKTGVEKYRRGLEEESGNYQYTYDALSRLTGVAKDGDPIKTFGYDSFGNRSFMVDKGVRTDYTYNPLNQLLRLENTQHTQDFSYDARGNLTRVLDNGKLKNSYEFSPLNHLTKAVSATGQVAEYQYNGLGLRVGKQIMDDLNPTKHINYVLDLTKQYHNMLQMTDDTKTKSYAWDFNVVSESGGDDTRFYSQDELGSPLRFTGVDGALVDSYGYDEFGNDFYGNQGLLQPFGYTGYTLDSISDTYFAQAREYDPMVGRFTAEDTIILCRDMPNRQRIIDPLSLNLYTYCQNNPIGYMDPSGQEAISISIGTGAAIALLVAAVTMIMVYWASTPEGQAAITQMATAIGQAKDSIEMCFANAENARATAIAYVDTVLNDKNNRINDYSNNSVYVLVDKNNKVHYVGRTNDPIRRAREHKGFLSNKKSYEMIVVKTGLDKDSARAWEQILISAYTLDALDNARREISSVKIVNFLSEFNRALDIMTSNSDFKAILEDTLDLLK